MITASAPMSAAFLGCFALDHDQPPAPVSFARTSASRFSARLICHASQ
jgi:hypothetical protein